MHSNKNYLVIICGPTASGKTAAAIQLAKHYKTEILSFDSRQLYRELAIGTAKPTENEQRKVRHHFIDTHSIHDAYSAGQFEKEAMELLDRCFEQHTVVVAVGGTGLYMNALIKGFDDIPKPTREIRDAVQKEYRKKGLAWLQETAMKMDPVACETTDMQNPHRLFRIVEVFRVSGKPISSFRKQEPVVRNFTPIKIGMDVPRAELYRQINVRTDQMIRSGLLEEVRELYDYRELNALQTVGYTELFRYLDGEQGFEEALEAIRRNTRRYAKRQLTWFRRDEEIEWIAPDEIKKMIALIEERMSE